MKKQMKSSENLEKTTSQETVKTSLTKCLKKVSSRFELVILAAKRARYLMVHNEKAKVEWDNNKATVVALSEIICWQSPLYMLLMQMEKILLKVVLHICPIILC